MPLKLDIPYTELFDEQTNRIYRCKECSITLEHSLVSIHKWEQKYHRAFFTKGPNNREELLDYIRFMTISSNTDPNVYYCLNANHFKELNEYMQNPMTASTIADGPQSNKAKDVVTAELIYYWMFELHIPYECRKWHIKTLLTQIRLCNAKQEKPRKMPKKAVMNQYSALNELRRQQLNTRG